MLRLAEIKLPLNHGEKALRPSFVQRLRLPDPALAYYAVGACRVDSRNCNGIGLVYNVDVRLENESELAARVSKNIATPSPDTQYRFVARATHKLATRPVVIGTGPCGLFAGLLLAQMGLNPIILERGKPVRERTKDTFGLWRQGVLNPESNVQFGEGGAGTFSDGKLHSQIKDPKH